MELQRDRGALEGHSRDAMPRPSFRRSLLALVLAVPACSLPSEEVVVAGPAFTLTADAPVAAFEVTLCIDGPKVDHAYVSGRVDFTARATATEPLQLDVEAIDAPDEELAVRLDLSPGAVEEDGLWMVAAGAFERGGRRCGDPEVVQFSVDELGALERVDVSSWQVTMNVEWEGAGVGKNLDDSDLSVEIVRL